MVTIHAKIVITLLRYSQGDLRITWIKAKKLHAYTGASNREELHSVCVFGPIPYPEDPALVLFRPPAFGY
jgi:hypothetical protein